MIFMEEGAKSAFGAKAVDDPHGFQDSPLDSPARTPGTRTPVLVRKQSDAPLPARIDTAALLVTVETSVGDQKMTIAEAIKTRPPAAYMDAFKDTMPLPAPRLHTAPAGARRPIAQPTPAMPTKQPTVKVVPTARFAGGASYLPGPPKPKLVPPDFDSADGPKTKPPVVLPLGLKFLYPPQPGSYSARERQPPAPHPNWIAAANVHLSPPATARADVGRKGRVFDRRKQQYPFGVLLDRSLVERQKQQQSQPAASPPNDSFRSSQPSRSRSPATARPAQSQAATAMALGAYGIATAAAPSAMLVPRPQAQQRSQQQNWQMPDWLPQAPPQQQPLPAAQLLKKVEAGHVLTAEEKEQLMAAAGVNTVERAPVPPPQPPQPPPQQPPPPRTAPEGASRVHASKSTPPPPSPQRPGTVPAPAPPPASPSLSATSGATGSFRSTRAQQQQPQKSRPQIGMGNGRQQQQQQPGDQRWRRTKQSLCGR